MKVIQFPGAAQLKDELKITSKLPKTTEILITKSFDYTCLNCGNTVHFHGENLIFRTIEFYCSNCGTIHRATNPAFSLSIKSEKNGK